MYAYLNFAIKKGAGHDNLCFLPFLHLSCFFFFLNTGFGLFLLLFFALIVVLCISCHRVIVVGCIKMNKLN